jgi:hypothetical protein
MLTSAPRALVKVNKTSNFCIEISVLYHELVMQNNIEAIWFPYHGPIGFYKQKKSDPFRPKERKRL